MIEPNPFRRMQQWLDEAAAHPAISEPSAMLLATATADGLPSVRAVLLKGLDERGLAFYTHDGSRKGRELAENPQAAICFYWMPLGRQLRAQGRVEPVGAAEADAYFASRRRESRIGAWASEQSRPLESRAALQTRIAEYETKFAGQDVPRPPYWNGWRLVPDHFEFWQEGDFRLHTRETYTRTTRGGWERGLLYP